MKNKILMKFEELLQKYKGDLLAVLATLIILVPLIACYGLTKVVGQIATILIVLIFTIAGLYLFFYILDKLD